MRYLVVVLEVFVLVLEEHVTGSARKPSLLLPFTIMVFVYVTPLTQRFSKLYR